MVNCHVILPMVEADYHYVTSFQDSSQSNVNTFSFNILMSFVVLQTQFSFLFTSLFLWNACDYDEIIQVGLV